MKISVKKLKHPDRLKEIVKLYCQKTKVESYEISNKRQNYSNRTIEKMKAVQAPTMTIAMKTTRISIKFISDLIL